MVQRDAKNAPAERTEFDVLVVGAGPSGLAIAAEFAGLGLETGLIAPDVGQRWGRSFGAFSSSIFGLGLNGCLKRTYDSPLVYANSSEPIRLSEPYVRFDTSHLQSHLLERAEKTKVRFLTGRVDQVSFDPDTRKTICSASMAPGPGDAHHEVRETRIEAKLVVNAAAGGLADDGGKPAGFQSAYGQWIEVEDHPFAEGEMSLMDYRPVDDTSGPASFLYAMPESGRGRGPGVVFVQETVLISREPIEMGVLQARLATRLASCGLVSSRVLGTERCLIPMGVPLPDSAPLVLPFGAAAGLVHPATGYQLTRALHLAPAVARRSARRLDAGPREASRAGMDVMWPNSRRRAWRMFAMGADVLGSLPPDVMRQFVPDFFDLPGGRWQRFMEGCMEPSEIAETMWRVFASAPWRLRSELVRGGSFASTRALAQKLISPIR